MPQYFKSEQDLSPVTQQIHLLKKTGILPVFCCRHKLIRSPLSYTQPGWSIILAFTFTFGILSGQIGFVSLAPVTKYVLIVCYDNQIGNSLIEINTKIVFKFRSIITKFADPFCHSSTLLLIGRQRSRDLFFQPIFGILLASFLYF